MVAAVAATQGTTAASPATSTPFRWILPEPWDNTEPAVRPPPDASDLRAILENIDGLPSDDTTTVGGDEFISLQLGINATFIGERGSMDTTNDGGGEADIGDAVGNNSWRWQRAGCCGDGAAHYIVNTAAY